MQLFNMLMAIVEIAILFTLDVLIQWQLKIWEEFIKRSMKPNCLEKHKSTRHLLEN